MIAVIAATTAVAVIPAIVLIFQSTGRQTAQGQFELARPYDSHSVKISGHGCVAANFTIPQRHLFVQQMKRDASLTLMQAPKKMPQTF